MMERRFSKESGAAIVEAALGLSLVIFIVLGFTEMYIRQTQQLDFRTIATELFTGPQERALRFNHNDPGTFEVLCKLPTCPDLGAYDYSWQEYADVIGNHFLGRRRNDEVLLLAIAWAEIDSATGLTNGNTVDIQTDEVQVYPSSDTGPCSTDQLKTRVRDYANAHIDNLAAYETTANVQVPIGVKLYDIVIGSDAEVAYIDFLPMVYFGICSESYGLFSSTPVAKMFPMVPRRLVN